MLVPWALPVGCWYPGCCLPLATSILGASGALDVIPRPDSPQPGPFPRDRAPGAAGVWETPMSCPELAGRWGPGCHPCVLGSKKSLGGAGAAGCGAQNHHLHPPSPPAYPGWVGGVARGQLKGWYPGEAGVGLRQSLPRTSRSQPRSRSYPGVLPHPPQPCHVPWPQQVSAPDRDCHRCHPPTPSSPARAE